jgi:signal transduction histidine kinase/CheY-like chemotaxis protein
MQFIKLKELIWPVAVFLAYLLAAKLGQYIFYTFDTSPAVIWPSGGIALAAVIFGGYRMLVPIFLAQFLSVITPPVATSFSIVIISSLGYTLQAAAQLYVLRKLRFEPDLRKIQNVLLLIGVGFLLTAIAPALITVAMMTTQQIAGGAPSNFGRFWAGGIFSALVITPFILSLRSYKPFSSEVFDSRQPYKTLELISAIAALGLINYLLYWTTILRQFGIVVIFFWPAILIWMALSFRPRWMTLAIFVSAILGITGTIIAHPTNNPIGTQLFSVQVYIGFMAAMFLIVVTIMDERRSAFKQLVSMYSAATEADRMKTQFIATLAHELRNPLFPLTSSLELLRMQPQTKESERIINEAQDQTDMIARLLEDLLDMSRLSLQNIRLKKENVSLSAIVDMSVASVKPYMDECRHTLNIVMPEEEVAIYADPVRIKQIIINLLNNAAKYTEPGGTVELSCKVVADNKLRIRVRDNGVGINLSDQPMIFDPFRTEHPTTRRLGTGLGIGLYITKNLVEKHGGTISVASNGPGQGSEFSVCMPLPMQIEKSKIAINSAKMTSRPGRMKKILVVDDNRAIVSSLSRIFKHHDYEVEAAYMGSQALSVVSSFNPDAILLDIGMPDMSGYDVAREIRKMGWSGLLIALTGYGQESDKKRSLEVGCDKHLVKPVSSQTIISILKGATGNV